LGGFIAWCPIYRPRLCVARQGSEAWSRRKPSAYEAVGRKSVQAHPPTGVSERAPSSMSQDLGCGEVEQFAKSWQHHPIGCSLVRASRLCSMTHLIIPHLHQTRPTKFAVKNVNGCPHDQTSLLSHSSTISSTCFGAFSQGGEDGFVALGFFSFPAGGKTASRKRERPCQVDLHARSVQTSPPATASDPAAITFRQSS
jgi:hypothetical protein